jgi:hypothetical protein
MLLASYRAWLKGVVPEDGSQLLGKGLQNTFEHQLAEFSL